MKNIFKTISISLPLKMIEFIGKEAKERKISEGKVMHDIIIMSSHYAKYCFNNKETKD